MKKRIFSRVLALFMALAMLSTTALADVSFDAVQDAINGNTQNGEQITNSDLADHYGYGKDETTGKFGVESWTTEGSTNVKLNDNAVATETTPTLTVEDKINIDTNGNSLTGDGKHDVIDVGEDGNLTITGKNQDTIAGDLRNEGTLTTENIAINGDVQNNGIFSITDTQIDGAVFNSGNATFTKNGTANQVKKEETLPSGQSNAGFTWKLENGKKTADGKKVFKMVVTADNDSGTIKMHAKEVFKDAALSGYTVTDIVFDNTVKVILAWAFDGCANLQSIQLPENLQSIGMGAFRGTGLVNITIPTSIENIPDESFRYCNNLKSITIPNSVKTIGKVAFQGCSSLTKVTIPKSVTSIGEEAFAGCSVETVIIPESVTSIGAGAFSGCGKLTSVTVPDTVKVIERCTFSGCNELTSIKIPDGVTIIKDRAFMGCKNLTDITIPTGVKVIEDSSFKNCFNLSDVTISEGVETIGPNAFAFSSITEIRIPATVTKIEDNAFRGTNLSIVEIPETVTTMGKDVFSWSPYGNPDPNIYPNPYLNVVLIHADTAENANAKLTDTKIESNPGEAVVCNIYFLGNDGTVKFGRLNTRVDITTLNGTEISISRTDGSAILPNGTVTVDADGVSTTYPYGGSITADGRFIRNEAPSDNPPVISFDFDAMGTDAGTTIEDDEVPLAGLVTLAELLEELRQYEDIEDMELPEDFQWVDHEYAQAIYWGLTEALVVDTEDDPLDPDEIVTVALLREVLENFVEYKGVDLTVTVEGEDDMIVMDLGERLTVFYGELEAALEGKAA